MIFERTRLFPLEGSKYDRNRIPGMIVTSKGTIIVYNEARHGKSDWSLMDIFALRSTDGGKSFGQPIILAQGSERHNVKGNPVMVEDNEGAIHFLHHEQYAINGGRVLHRVSLDDGVTWSQPEDITQSTLPQFRHVFALGPGHGILNAKGEIIIPVWYVPKYKVEPKDSADFDGHVPSVLSTIYSRDNGKTWRMGQVIEDAPNAPSPNEAEFALTSDGKVIVYARVLRQNRAIGYSDTGYNYWNYSARPELIDSICFGSIISCKHNGKHVLITANCINQSENVNSITKRDVLATRYSLDDGKTWSDCKVINDGVECEYERGGYIELAYDSTRGKVYVLHETDLGKTDYFIVTDVEYLLS